MRDDYQRLLDIGEGIERIERYTAGGRSEFDRDELVQTWVLHHLQIIGEAARLLSPGCKSKQPDIPWEKINGMRNILVHHYFGIDTEIVWAAVERELPRLNLGGQPTPESPLLANLILFAVFGTVRSQSLQKQKHGNANHDKGFAIIVNRGSTLR